MPRVNIGDMLFCAVTRQYDLIPETVLMTIFVDKIVVEITAEGHTVKYYGGSIVVEDKNIGKTAFTNLDEALAHMRELVNA